eukprot:110897_1
MHCCATCNTRDAKLRCSACKLPFYCNSSCQTSHWKAMHKRQCKFLRENVNTNHTIDTFIESVRKACLGINKSLSQVETSKQEQQLMAKYNLIMQSIFYYCKKINRSNEDEKDKLTKLAQIVTFISNHDLSREFEGEITPALFQNNDDSAFIQTSLKNHQPSKESIHTVISDIHFERLKLNDARNIMFYKMHHNITSHTLQFIVNGLNIALNDLHLELKECTIDPIVEYFAQQILKQDTIARPEGCSDLVRFDASYTLRQESAVLIHGYMRNIDARYIAPIEIVSLCSDYCDMLTKDDSVNAGKLKVTTEYAYDDDSPDSTMMIGFHYGTTWNMDCAGDLFGFTGAVGYKGRDCGIEEFYLNPNKNYKMQGVRSSRGLSSPSHMIYCDDIRDTFWVAGDHRIKCSGYIENGTDTTYEDYEVSCDYILSHASIKGSKTLFATNEKVFVFADHGMFYTWDYEKLLEHQTDYHCESYDDDSVPKVNEHGIKTEAYSIIDAGTCEGDQTYEVSGGQKHMDSFQIDTKGINDIKFSRSQLAIGDDMNEFDGYLYIANGKGIYQYNLEKKAICGALLGHNIGCAQLSFRQYLLDEDLLISHDWGLVKVWDLRSNEAVISIKASGDHNAYECMTAIGFGFYGSGNKYVASGGRDEAVTIWDLRQTNALYEISAGNNTIKQLVWHQASASLIAASDTGIYSSYWGNQRSDYETVKWPTDAVHQRTDFPKEFDITYNEILVYNFMEK